MYLFLIVNFILSKGVIVNKVLFKMEMKVYKLLLTFPFPEEVEEGASKFIRNITKPCELTYSHNPVDHRVWKKVSNDLKRPDSGLFEGILLERLMKTTKQFDLESVSMQSPGYKGRENSVAMPSCLGYESYPQKRSIMDSGRAGNDDFCLCPAPRIYSQGFVPIPVLSLL
jgi:hypothetical protein